MGSIFGLVAGTLFTFEHNYTGLLFVLFALVSFGSALIANKGDSSKASKKANKKEKNMTTRKSIIGKKTVVSIGSEPPKDDPDEIVGESTVLHVTPEEAKKYDRIVGVESKVIIGDPEDKGK